MYLYICLRVAHDTLGIELRALAWTIPSPPMKPFKVILKLGFSVSIPKATLPFQISEDTILVQFTGNAPHLVLMMQAQCMAKLVHYEILTIIVIAPRRNFSTACEVELHGWYTHALFCTCSNL